MKLLNECLAVTQGVSVYQKTISKPHVCPECWGRTLRDILFWPQVPTWLFLGIVALALSKFNVKTGEPSLQVV